MNEERDPRLESLFAEEASIRPADEFTAQVMDRVSRRRRNVFIGRLALLALLIAFELVMSSPLQNSAGTLTQALGTTLVELENDWAAALLAPLNSLAGLIGILLLGLHAVYRKVMH